MWYIKGTWILILKPLISVLGCSWLLSIPAPSPVWPNPEDQARLS